MIAQLRGNLLEILRQSPLTQGSVGQKLAVSLSGEWSDLAVTAVFYVGALSRDVVVSGGEITIPWELLAEPEHKLYLNFHGALPDGSIVLRSNIASLGPILPSRAPSGDPPEAPSPTRADQIQALAEQALAVAQSVHTNPGESPVFWAVRNTTTFDELLAAYQADKVCLCEDGGLIYVLSVCDSGSPLFGFSCINGGMKALYVYEDDSWDAITRAIGDYSKPSGGIPKTDLASAVQTSLGKADTALQSYTETDPTVPSWAKASSKPSYTASEVGAIAAPSSPASGAFLVWNGSAWVAQTLSTWQASSY